VSPRPLAGCRALDAATRRRRFALSISRLKRIKSQVTVGRYKYALGAVATVLVAAAACSVVGALAVATAEMELTVAVMLAVVTLCIGCAGCVSSSQFYDAVMPKTESSVEGLESPALEPGSPSAAAAAHSPPRLTRGPSATKGVEVMVAKSTRLAIVVCSLTSIAWAAVFAWAWSAGQNTALEYLLFQVATRLLEFVVLCAILYTVASGRQKLNKPVCAADQCDIAYCLWLECCRCPRRERARQPPPPRETELAASPSSVSV
jgi:hypothetical protein